MALDRRTWLAGAGALLATGAATGAGAADAQPAYDYLFLDLEDAEGTTPPRAYAAAVKARLPQIQAAGGEVLGLFTPQIGWVARQAALLVRWSPTAKGRDGEVTALTRGKAVRFGQRERLEPTTRPTATDRPKPGGIYVHRRFVIEAKNVPEFLTLSSEGWRDFESRFDANIFGLFTAERTMPDRQQGVTRLLLITRYKDHGVWEASRDPSTAAMDAFRRRSAITRDTWNASTLFVPI
jgi:hypothetical protein